MTVVAVTGNFDGLHRGHAFLFNELIKRSVELNKKALVVSFSPHTRQFVKKIKIDLLTTDLE